MGNRIGTDLFCLGIEVEAAAAHVETTGPTRDASLYAAAMLIYLAAAARTPVGAGYITLVWHAAQAGEKSGQVEQVIALCEEVLTGPPVGQAMRAQFEAMYNRLTSGGGR